MIIDNLYSNPQILQVIAGNFQVFFLLADFGEFQPSNVDTRKLENKYFFDGITEIKRPPIGILNWPCKLKNIEILAGEVFVHMKLILSSSNKLITHKDISSHISEEYSNLERNFYNRDDVDAKPICKNSPSYTQIPYPKSSDDVAIKGAKTRYYQARAGYYPDGITPLVNYVPAGNRVAIKFDFRFIGFKAKSTTEILARDALLEQICDEFMSHVKISPLPLDEHSTPIATTDEDDDGW